MKINLGSGQKYLEGYVNVDISDDHGHKVDVLADVTKKLPFDDNSADLIVAEHICEHIPMHELLGVLQDWHRVLKPGGRLVIAVPNVRALSERYVNNEITHYIFCVNMYGPYNGHETDLHRWGYDHADLERILREVPFQYIREYQGDLEFAQDWWINIREGIK